MSFKVQTLNYGLGLDPAVASDLGGLYAPSTATALSLTDDAGYTSLFSVTLAGTIKPASANSIRKGIVIGSIPLDNVLKQVIGRRILNCRTDGGMCRVDIQADGTILYNDASLTPTTFLSFDGIVIVPDVSRG